ncbi:unnamed protein product [Soboliphyme baturini]|uniref:Uncharacterized protein n=1 Tax=Soboliphyme baturini TaxID=241478 RepID=A0A3P8I078_9BILA|nr:unnamed protein product [Soboliphyme baturini]
MNVLKTFQAALSFIEKRLAFLNCWDSFDAWLRARYADLEELCALDKSSPEKAAEAVDSFQKMENLNDECDSMLCQLDALRLENEETSWRSDWSKYLSVLSQKGHQLTLCRDRWASVHSPRQDFLSQCEVFHMMLMDAMVGSDMNLLERLVTSHAVLANAFEELDTRWHGLQALCGTSLFPSSWMESSCAEYKSQCQTLYTLIHETLATAFGHLADMLSARFVARSFEDRMRSFDLLFQTIDQLQNGIPKLLMSKMSSLRPDSAEVGNYRALLQQLPALKQDLQMQRDQLQADRTSVSNVQCGIELKIEKIKEALSKKPETPSQLQEATDSQQLDRLQVSSCFFSSIN